MATFGHSDMPSSSILHPYPIFYLKFITYFTVEYSKYFAVRNVGSMSRLPTGVIDTDLHTTKPNEFGSSQVIQRGALIVTS